MKRKLWIALPVALIVVLGGLMFWYNNEPELFDPVTRAHLHAQAHGHADVTGTTTTSALLEVVDEMLHKRGGSSGPHPPNPSELLASDRMRQFVNWARKQFDFVIVDSPPVLAVSDAVLPSALSDGVILCFHANRILREDARSSVKQLQLAGVKVLGVVLNRYQPGSVGHYDRRYRYYEAYAESADSADSAA